MRVDELQLQELLLDAGLLSQANLTSLKRESAEKGLNLGEVAVAQGHLTQDDLSRLTAYALGIPFVNLKNRKLDLSTLSLIPEPLARHYALIAFDRRPKTLEVALLDIDNLSAIESLGSKLGLRILPRLTDTESMRHSLLSYQNFLRNEFGDTIQQEAGKLRGESAAEAGTRAVDTLIRHALLQDASHIHIEPSENDLLVRYRIGHALHEAMVLPKVALKSIIRRLKQLAGIPLASKEISHQGRFRIDDGGEKISFSLSILPVEHGDKAVVRILRENAAGFTLEALGFHGGEIEDIHQALESGAGLILVAGPKKSGKTTTLYTMLDLLNTPERSLATIEDPVEHVLPRVNQSRVAPKIGHTFAQGLRALLRQNPDVIMVGDVPDAETANLTLTAALTEHLVLASLEAKSTEEVFKKLQKFNVDQKLLTQVLKLIIFQEPSAGAKDHLTHRVIRMTPFTPV